MDSIVRNGFKILFKSFLLLTDVPIDLIQFFPLLREEFANFSRNGQWKGYLQFLLPDILVPTFNSEQKSRLVSLIDISYEIWI